MNEDRLRHLALDLDPHATAELLTVYKRGGGRIDDVKSLLHEVVKRHQRPFPYETPGMGEVARLCARVLIDAGRPYELCLGIGEGAAWKRQPYFEGQTRGYVEWYDLAKFIFSGDSPRPPFEWMDCVVDGIPVPLCWEPRLYRRWLCACFCTGTDRFHAVASNGIPPPFLYGLNSIGFMYWHLTGGGSMSPKIAKRLGRLMDLTKKRAQFEKQEDEGLDELWRQRASDWSKIMPQNNPSLRGNVDYDTLYNILDALWISRDQDLGDITDNLAAFYRVHLTDPRLHYRTAPVPEAEAHRGMAEHWGGLLLPYLLGEKP